MRSHQKVYQISVERFEPEGGDPAGYLATNEELGLVVEADSLDLLRQRVCALAPELFAMNVLPTLRPEASVVPPAFILNHVLGCDGREILSRTN